MKKLYLTQHIASHQQIKRSGLTAKVAVAGGLERSVKTLYRLLHCVVMPRLYDQLPKYRSTSALCGAVELLVKLNFLLI